MHLVLSRRVYVYIFGPLVGLLLLWLVATLLGLRFNNSSSAPVGLYYEITNSPSVDNYVVINMKGNSQAEIAADREYFNRSSNGDLLLCKRIAALPGDIVNINNDGFITVNGMVIENSKLKDADSLGQSLTSTNVYPFNVPEGHYFVMGLTVRSFDSRYFGPVKDSRIQAVVVPLLTWSDQ